MNRRTLLASALSLLAIAAAVAHAFFPEIVIDSVTVALLAIAVAPWLGIFFKSLELPGGVKIEYHDLKAVEEKARDVGLIKDEPAPSKTKDQAVYERIAAEDPNLALVSLRIEIEKALRLLGANRGIVGTNNTVGWIARELTKDGVLPQGTATVLADLIPLLNKAAHGAKVDQQSVEWALTAGAQILNALKEK